MQVYSSVGIGSFSFEVEKLLCFNICGHFKKRGLICGPLTLTAGSPLEGGGMGQRMNSHVAYQKTGIPETLSCP